jgi:anti-sigma B factor antagonist
VLRFRFGSVARAAARVDDSHMTSQTGCRSTSSVTDDGSVVVTLVGELDAESAPAVFEDLRALVTPSGTLKLDLAGLEFLDSTGLGVLIRTLNEVRASGGRFLVVNPSPRVLRLIATSHLLDLFGLGDTVPSPPDSPLRAVRDAATLEEVRALLVGFENLLRWGDLRAEQVTLALAGAELAEDTTDLALAARVREALRSMGAAPGPSPVDD